MAHRRHRLAVFAALALVASVAVISGPASAEHGLASLPGSNFEIDDDANLKPDHGDPSLDWGNVDELIAFDTASGQDDDSYKGGTKEDTECPDEVTGSIPNNKSDLLTVHGFKELDTPGFLNIAWSRVSEPSGTTLMDFEFNQSTDPCPTGPNVQRTVGDLLIEYAIDQGGSRATLSAREWDGSAWGPEEEISAPNPACGGDPCAVGTINQSVIPLAESYELNAEKQQFTFGEAQIDLDFIFDDEVCTSFGSAMVKSRSSDSFTSQLKDFIPPVPINLTNCGSVIINKQTIPPGETQEFTYQSDVMVDPGDGQGPQTGTIGPLADGESTTLNNVLFGTYQISEDTPPAGWSFKSLDCSASTGVTPSINGATVDFTIDSPTDVLNCTYVNEALASLTFVKVAERDGVDFDYTTTGGLMPDTFSLANGESQSYSDLPLGTYGATETVPEGWNLVSATCDNGDSPDSVTLGAGDDVTCTFVNEVERGAVKIHKERKHAAAEGGSEGHEGVTFTVTNPNGTNEVVVTDSNGDACVTGLPVSTLDGDYTVTETLPAGYANDTLVQTATVVEGGCDDQTVTTFTNTPLTDVSIVVNSQVDGGTASVIECTSAQGTVSASTDPSGDGGLTVSDLLPTDPETTITCTVVVDP